MAPCLTHVPSHRRPPAFKDRGLDIIGISLDNSREKLDTYITDEKLEWHFSYSGKGWGDDHVKLYGVNSIPSIWLIDRKGTLRHFDLHGDALYNAVTELIAE